MSQFKSAGGYAVAGCQFAEDDYFHVQDQVHVPDGNAGTECASCFQGKAENRRHRGPATISVRSALVFLTALILICGFCLGGQLHERKEISLRISSMQNNMQSTRTDNEQLLMDVQSARDSSRVCYIAVNELGMVAAQDANVEYIYVEEIEQFTKAETKQENLSAAHTLPLMSGQAQLTGSR